MSDQTLVENRALKQPSVERPSKPLIMARKVATGWRVTRDWTRFLLTGSRWGVPELADFVVKNYPFNAFQVPAELTALGELLAARRPERALEIGTFRGGTLLFLAQLASPDATLVSVDLPGGKFGGGYSDARAWCYRRFARRHQRLQLLRGDSHSTQMQEQVAAAFSGHKVDYLFIDGDHSYDGAKRDFELYAPMVRKGGLIAFHDIVDGDPEMVGGVPRFWSEIKSPYRHEELIKDRQQRAWGIGVLHID